MVLMSIVYKADRIELISTGILAVADKHPGLWNVDTRATRLGRFTIMDADTKQYW